MSYSTTLVVVLAAVYGLVGLVLSGLVALAWHAAFRRMRPSAGEVLALRLAPAGGAALLALAVVMPAFMQFEPAHATEGGGPLLVVLAGLGLLTVAAGLRRAWRACVAARKLLKECDAAIDRSEVASQPIGILDMRDPLVALVGGWRPRIVASRCVLAACTAEELSQVIAHEMAHIAARDNLKLLLLVLAPDPLAWLPTGRSLAAHWRVLAEREADECAAGSDRRKRLALAAALIKVARLSTVASAQLPKLSMQVALDDVEGRVRRLMAASPPARRWRVWRWLAVCALLVPAAGVPLYGIVHEFSEALVAFGR